MRVADDVEGATGTTAEVGTRDGGVALIDSTLHREHLRWHHGATDRGRCERCGGCKPCGEADGRLTRPGRCVCRLVAEIDAAAEARG